MTREAAVSNLIHHITQPLGNIQLLKIQRQWHVLF